MAKSITRVVGVLGVLGACRAPGPGVPIADSSDGDRCILRGQFANPTAAKAWLYPTRDGNEPAFAVESAEIQVIEPTDFSGALEVIHFAA